MKRILILIIFSTLFMLSSCNRGPQPLEIHKGTEGITIDFGENIPPPQVYEGQYFLILANLWNKGAYTFNESRGDYGVVNIDYDPLYFNSSQNNQNKFYSDIPTFQLAGKSLEWPNGEKLNKEISLLGVNNIPGTRESPKVKLTASACYPYMTVLTQEICVDVDAYKADQNPVCRNKGTYTYTGGQGAPVSITEVEVSMIPLGSQLLNRPGSVADTDEEGRLIGMKESNENSRLFIIQPYFKIKIKNAGDGLVMTRTENIEIKDICSPTTGDRTFNDINNLKIDAWLGGTKLTCNPNPVRVLKDETQATCFLPREDASGVNRNYMSILTVKLDYVYRSFTERKITILRSNYK